MVEVVRAVSPKDLGAVRGLMRVYTAWAASLDPEAEKAPTFQGLDDEIAGLPGVYAPPLGCLLLARSAGEPAGIIALKPHSEACGEIKRLYVDPAFRGQRIGPLLVEAILNEARKAGYKKLVLDSYHAMTAAHALYRQAGFVECSPLPGYPEHLLPKLVFMKIELT